MSNTYIGQKIQVVYKESTFLEGGIEMPPKGANKLNVFCTDI